MPWVLDYSLTKSCPTLCNPWIAARQPSLFFTISQSFLKLISVGWWCHPTISPSAALFSCLQSFRASGSFPMSQLFRWPKYWHFSISLSNEYSRLISFSIDCFDLLAVEDTLKSLLQHHSLKASILRCSVFFIVQLSHPYMTTGKIQWVFRVDLL